MGRIVQGASVERDHPCCSLRLTKHQTAADRAEMARGRQLTVAQRPVCPGLAIDLYCFSGENHEGYMARSAGPLAVATIAMPSESRLRVRVVAHQATQASARHHSHSPLSFSARNHPGQMSKFITVEQGLAAARRKVSAAAQAATVGIRDVQRASMQCPPPDPKKSISVLQLSRSIVVLRASSAFPNLNATAAHGTSRRHSA